LAIASRSPSGAATDFEIPWGRERGKISVTFASVFGTSLVEGPFFEEAQAMRELSELVEAAQAGDSEAYGALIQRFQQMAYATAYTYLGDHHLAEDLVQEAALEAFVHLPQLKETAAFPGWFRQIVFRQCTRVLRQTTLQCISLEAVSEGLLAESNPEDPADDRQKAPVLGPPEAQSAFAGSPA
jgi:hypothetical protein